MKREILSIVITCYNEQENIQEMYSRIVKIFKKLKNYSPEIIFVDNDSTDNSDSIYTKLTKKDKRVKVIKMSRNFGSPQPSFLAGMTYASGDAVVLLHGDIQDPPEIIPTFIQTWKAGYDVVYGIRTKRDGYGFFWNLSYKTFYYLLKKLAYISVPLDAGEFSLMSKQVVKELLRIPEYDYFVRCLRAFVGFKQIGIPYVRQARIHGQSTESFFKGLWWAKQIILNFSFQPLLWISYLGFSVTIMSVLFIILNLLLVLVFNQRAPGVPTVLIATLFLGGVQLLSLSVIAEYLAKIFLEVKARPRFIIKQTINLDKKPEHSML